MENIILGITSLCIVVLTLVIIHSLKNKGISLPKKGLLVPIHDVDLAEVPDIVYKEDLPYRRVGEVYLESTDLVRVLDLNIDPKETYVPILVNKNRSVSSSYYIVDKFHLVILEDKFGPNFIKGLN